MGEPEQDREEAAQTQGPRKVRVGDVCDIAKKDRKIQLTASERLAHKGPYPLYAEDCAVSYFDDYVFEAGGTVMVSAIGRVLSGADGSLIATVEPGRCSAVPQLHALLPHDSAEAAYIQRALTTSPMAARFVTGSPQLRELSASALKAVSLPWPDADGRSEYVRALEELDERRLAVEARIPKLYAAGDAAFARDVLGVGSVDDGREASHASSSLVRFADVCTVHRGTDVPATARAADKPVRVEGPNGRLGRCDEAICEGPTLVIGPSARHLLAHLVEAPSHPIAEMAYVEKQDSSIDLAVLLFSLRAAGILEKNRPIGAKTASGVEVPRLTVDELGDFEIDLGDSQAHADFAELGWGIIAQVSQAERELDRIAAARRDVVMAQLAIMSQPADKGEERPEESAAGANRSATDAKKSTMSTADAAKSEPSAADAAESALRRARLHPLASLAGCGSWGISADDLAWEIAPVLVLRCCLDAASWKAIVKAAEQGAADGIVSTLDTGLTALSEQDDLLSFLPNLSYTSSLLTPAQLAECVRGLDAVDSGEIGADEVRGLFRTSGDSGEGAPASVCRIVEAMALAACPDADSAYVPCETDGFACDMLSRALPRATVRVQFDEFSQALQASLVRAVAARPVGGLRGGFGAAVGSALLADEFPDWNAPLVVADLPADATEWIDRRPDPDDPRWILGLPPRKRCTFAWIEHALSHLEQGGTAILVMENSALHLTTGSDPALRRKLIERQCVRCVVSLPAGIFADGRPASSIVALGDAGSAASTLFVDAIDLGLSLPREARGPRRVLGVEAVGRIVRAVSDWLSQGTCEQKAGFSRVLGTEEIIARGATLAPWALV